MEKLLNEPCLWCGYNGQGYWRVGTHKQECLWHQVGGFHNRIVMVPDYIQNTAATIAALRAAIKKCEEERDRLRKAATYFDTIVSQNLQAADMIERQAGTIRSLQANFDDEHNACMDLDKKLAACREDRAEWKQTAGVLKEELARYKAAIESLNAMAIDHNWRGVADAIREAVRRLEGEDGPE